MNGNTRALFTILLAALCSGCVQETVREPGGGVRLFEPPEDLDSMLVAAGTFHGVELIFELNPKTDVPPGEDVRTIVPTMKGDRIVYHAVGGHTVGHHLREFEIGGFRYPSRDGGKLFVFKKRTGDFRFKYRTQDIVVRQKGTWTPTVRLISKRKRGADGDVVAIQEYVQMGFATIEISSDSPGIWKVNGDDFQPGKRTELEISGAIDFEGR